MTPQHLRSTLPVLMLASAAVSVWTAVPRLPGADAHAALAASGGVADATTRLAAIGGSGGSGGGSGAGGTGSRTDGADTGAGGWSGDERIAVTGGEMERLGITLSVPSRAQRVPMRRVSARVTVPPAQQFVVAAATDGLLTRLLVAAGDAVSADQPIAAIESPGLVTLQRDLLDAHSRLRLARQRLDRDQSLLSDGIIPERRLEETRSDFEEASHRVALARQRLLLAGYSASALDALVASAELSPRLTIGSPVDGTILEQYASPGQRLAAADPILRIADLSQLWLVLQVPPEQLRRISPGQLVVPADRPDSPLARVDTLGAVLDPATQTIAVRAVLLPSAESFGAGEFLSVQVLADQEDGQAVWSLPQAAVVRLGERDAVFVRDADAFVARPVQRLSEAADRYLVTGASLTADTRIAVSGTATLKAMWQEARQSPDGP